MADGADHGWPERRLFPVIKRDREEHRACRRLQRYRVGAHERCRHVFGAGRLIRPLHPWLWQYCFVLVGQIRFAQHHFARLLAGGDDQRSVAFVRCHQVAHRVSSSRTGVHIDQRRLAGGLGEPVGHGEHRGFLQSQNVGEVIREVLQERLLGGARVAEHRRQPQRAK
jgi:hypothetical protein